MAVAVRFEAPAGREALTGYRSRAVYEVDALLEVSGRLVAVEAGR